MKIFGISLLTLAVIITVGYMLGVTMPGFGKTLVAKVTG
jgi:hypothetical protein